MKKLIDADALIEFIDVGHLRHPGKLAFSELDVVNMLNHAPTAYDVNKVVKQLSCDECETCELICECNGNMFDGFMEKICEIVERGGIDE